MKFILFLLLAQLTLVGSAKNIYINPPKPDLIIKATQFRLVDADKKIYFRAEISNIGDAPCSINSFTSIQTYLSADNIIGSDIISGSRAIPGNFILEAGTSKLLIDEYFISYTTIAQLQANPYCVIEISLNPQIIESNSNNNKSIYKHGFPRKKGEGVSNQPGDIPTQQADNNIDLQLAISNISSAILTDNASGKQYKEYTYTATIKNLGNYDAVIDLDKAISFQYRLVTSCQDTSGSNTTSRPVNQDVAYIIKPGKSLVLTGRKTKKPHDATTAILIELFYGGNDRVWYNNFACIPN